MTEFINTVITGDCLIESDKIASGSVDLILTDLPYGNMQGGPSKRNERLTEIRGWDLAIDPKKVYEIANRILRKNGKMVLFSQEPYTTRLINEVIPNIPFAYRAIWEKDSFAVALGANKNMVSYYEDILVLSKSHQKHDFEGGHPLREYASNIKIYTNYSRQAFLKALGHSGSQHFIESNKESSQFSLCTEKTYNELIQLFGIDKMEGFKEYEELKFIDTEFRQALIKKMNEQCPSTFNLWEGGKYKSNILRYKKDYSGYHPTQKPVLLLEDLIKTFSNEGDTVVDLTAGSGSTAVAAVNTKRNFIAIEQDVKYADIARQRVFEAYKTEVDGGANVG